MEKIFKNIELLNFVKMLIFTCTGAVLFGIDPSVVVIRKSRLTYGLGVLNRFIEGETHSLFFFGIY